MRSYRRLLLLLLVLASVLVIGFLWLVADNVNHEMDELEWLANLGLVIVAGLLLLSAWHLGRKDRAGWGCVLLIFGFPGSFVGYIIVLLMAGTGGHH